jgi:hypothetical protein
MPATTAAAAHTPKAKTVSLSPVAPHVARPDTCPHSNVSHVWSSASEFRQQVAFSAGACIYFVSGYLTHGQTKLEMRTRIYEYAGGPRVFSNYVHGGLGPFHSYTFFYTYPNVYGEAVCIALVESSHTGVVKYGPLCASY